jgi:hypothetical protein
MARCEHCNKKLGITEYKCKCDKLFCITHLQPEIHTCSYDYKSQGVSLLKKQLEIGALKDKFDGERL